MLRHDLRECGQRFLLCALLAAASFATAPERTLAAPKKIFRAGAHSMDITPPFGPLRVNGAFTERSVASLPPESLHARCLVLDDGDTQIAIVVVDNCMLPREVCDRAKDLASQATGLATNRILISATHTHSAPSVMDFCLGARADRRYTDFLPLQLAKGIERAFARLAPAHVGWTTADASGYTHCRRWILRPDKMGVDPFGEQTVRAMMHPGHQNPAYIGPAGPVDSQLSLLAVRTPDGRPLAVLANFSMHYLGGAGPADYFGQFAQALAGKLAQDEASPPICMMSQGTSGDLQWMDYSRPRRSIRNYADSLASMAHDAYQDIEFRDWAPLAMDEQLVTFSRRRPTAERLDWARNVLDARPGLRPQSRSEVYAEQAVFIDKNPTVEVKLQALRIGELGITAMPNEVYGITGLKLKLQSPLKTTFNIELANGAAGYIPPPSQHRLGGYTTWPARTAGLEESAEPKIVETLLSSLETISGRKRRPLLWPAGSYVGALSQANPVALWRMDEIHGFEAADATGQGNRGVYHKGVAFFLEGPQKKTFSDTQTNRAAHFAGGYFQASLPELANEYSVSLWFWNGMPVSARAVTGTLFARGDNDARESLFIGGNGDAESTGKLAFRVKGKTITGSTDLQLKQWHQVTLVRSKEKVAVYLDGNPDPEIASTLKPCEPASRIFIAGDDQKASSFEGKLDEVAVFPRALSADDVARLYRLSEMQPPPRPKPVAVIGSKPADTATLARVGQAVLASQPLTYWRLHDRDPKVVRDATENNNHGVYEQQASAFRPDTPSSNFSGGRVRAELDSLPDTYSVEFWFWNETPHHARPVTAYLFSRGEEGQVAHDGDHLGIGGTHLAAGKLIVFNGNRRDDVLSGSTELVPRSWNHVVMVRRKDEVSVYLNGNVQPDIQGKLPVTHGNIGKVFLGGRSDNFANLAGRIDEAAIYDRALTPEEVKAHFDAVGVKPVAQPASRKRSVVPDADEVDAEGSTEPAPMDVEQAIKTIHVREGFKVELVAAEPLVKDPVAIDWGPDGKLWVVEMADYPLGIDGKGKPGGRVRFLEDTNDDGRYDKSTLFAEGLSFPTGILVWGRGVLVTAAPEVVYLEDSSGDGTADTRRVLYSGFLEGNQQLRVNGLRWGLDNWVYCASGSHHGGYGKDSQITSHVTGKRHQIGSRDFRIRPDTGAIDPQSGPSQYGRNRDDWGNWFGVQNSRPLWHYVLADHHIRRNPNFAPPDPKHQVVTPLNPRVYPASKLQKRYHSFSQSGRFTSACSAMIYRDDYLFKRGPEQHAFTCEPFHNLVQHNLISDDGVSFKFRRDPAESSIDFFASEDRWCRPVMVRTGPDGALWVVDMYRYMIEHPQWLPQNGKDELRPWYRTGENHGRIYRVVRSDQPPRRVPKLAELSPQELAATLVSSNGWQRDTAQRLLVTAEPQAAIEPLRELAANSPQPLARLHALCTLDGLGELTSEQLEAALVDHHPAIRRQAVRIAARVTVAPHELAKLIADPDAKVRLELAATLGEYDSPAADDALARLLIDSVDDQYLKAATISSLNPRNVSAVLERVIQSSDPGSESMRLELIEQAIAMGDPDLLGRIVRLACPTSSERPDSKNLETLARVLDSIARRERQSDALPPTARDRIAESIQHARAAVTNRSASEQLRIAAVKLLGREQATREDDFRLMKKLLTPQTPVTVQRAIVSHLARRSEAEVPEILLAGWRGHGPELRRQILDTLASRPPWSETLRTHLEAGAIAASELDASVRQRLLDRNKNSQRWRAALAMKASTNRAEVLRRYQGALTLRGDSRRGAVVFRKICINCHKVKDEGHEVGPQLASITNKTKEALLTSILDPNASVDAKYLNYSIITDDGRSFSGKLETETGSSITLLAAEGKRTTVLRRDIEVLQASTKSVMPEGLERDLKPQDLADLIQFVRDTFE